MAAILVVVGTLALCFGVDRLFTKLFRSKVQHRSGLSVRLNKRYASFGLILAVIGVAGLISGTLATAAMILGGVLVTLLGIGLVVYYMTFGIYYDGDSFIVTTFGSQSRTYRFGDICCQQLYVVQGGNTVVDLYMKDGRTVQVQSGMEGAYAFLDHAFTAWLRQTGRDSATCDFHDPGNSVWFPPLEA